jgi:hypothetical protein
MNSVKNLTADTSVTWCLTDLLLLELNLTGNKWGNQFHYKLSKNSLHHESDFSVVAFINIGLASVYKKKQELEKAAILFEETLLYSETNDIWMLEARAFNELVIFRTR